MFNVIAIMTLAVHMFAFILKRIVTLQFVEAG